MNQPEPAVATTLAALLAARRQSLAGRIAEAVRRRAGAAPILADSRTLEDFDALLARALRTVCADRPAAVSRSDQFAWGIGAAWARRGCPLSDVLGAYGVPLRVIVDFVHELSDDLIGEQTAQLEIVGALFTFWNELTAAIAVGYHACGAHGSPSERQRDELVRALLWGTTGAVEDFGQLLLACAVSESAGYHALRARPASGTTLAELAHAHGFVSGRRDDGGLCAVVDGKLVGFLTAVPPGKVPGVSGLGPARPLRQLSESFRMASRALAAADRRGLTGIHEFGDLGLLAAAVPDDDAVGESLARRYLHPFGDSDSAAEIVDTVHEFLLNGMHVARTAEQVFVHPNTVRYRIGRFEDLAGVTLRTDPLVMFEVLWALEYRAAQRRSVGGSPDSGPPAGGRRRPPTVGLPRPGRAA